MARLREHSVLNIPMMRRNCNANLYDIILLFCRVILEGDFVLLNKTFLYEIQVQFSFIYT